MITIENKALLKGRFKFTVTRPDGSAEETDWFDNLVLDSGLNSLGTNSIMAYCHVGEGQTEPRAEQTGLDSPVAHTGSLAADTNVTTGANAQEGFHWVRKTFRFPQGIATGRLKEVGVGWGTNNSSLFNRALIRDAKGQVTTIVVLSDEVLDVTVELRCYNSLIPATGSINSVSRLKDDTEEITVRQLQISPLFNSLPHTEALIGARCYQAYGYGGPITGVTSFPTLSIGLFNTPENLPYTVNRERSFEIFWGLSQGNARPLKTVVCYTSLGIFQVEVDIPYEKSPQHTLLLQFKLSWGRYE